MLLPNVCSRPKFVRRSLLFLVFAALLFAPVVMPGQSYFGTVSGEVTDPSGAVVPGAKVVLTDQAKGYTFKATSDNGGRYLFTTIPPGLYSVSAEVNGFEKAVRTNVKLNVTENVSVNFALKMASTTQTVQVNAQTQTMATEDAVTGEVVNRRFINDLPLLDRYVMDLTYLAPGVTDMSDSNHVGDTGTNFVSNGSRGASADILMDGASMTNFEPNGGITQATYTPSAEAVEEFKVQQTNFSAEYGFTGASVVNMVTRSGENAFHGSGYDFIRNVITDSNNWFANEAGQPIPGLHRNNYGGTIGGPILKNKTFFFFDWDGTRESSQGVFEAGVPSAAERTGDFGELCGDAGGGFNASGLCVDSTNTLVPAGQIYDAYTSVYCPGVSPLCPDPSTNPPAGAYRSPLGIPYNNIANYTSPGNPKLNGTPYQLPQVAGNLIDGVAQKMMNLFPSPNYSSGSPYYNWAASGPNLWKNDQFDIKVDHRFNEKNLLSVKYSQDWSHFDAYDCFGNMTDPCGSGPNSNTAHLISINDTHTFTPTVVLATTFGFTRGAFRNSQYNPAHGADPLGTLGFPSYLKSNGVNGVPAIYIGGGYYSAGSTSTGDDPYGNAVQGQDTGQLGTLLNLVRGKHGFKFGFEGRLHQQNLFGTNAPLGTFGFDNLGSSQCPDSDMTVCGGDGMASFMMGIFGGGGYQIQFAPATESFQYAWFIQDNWKIKPKLTLNLGLRYDVNLPRTERHNRMNSYDPNATNPLNNGSLTFTDPVSQEVVTRALVGEEVFNNASHRTNWVTDWKDIQPRFGFAYQITPKTVLRGGYGIYFGQNRSGANGLLSYGSQGYNQWTQMIASYQNDGATPYLRMNNPFPNGLVQPAKPGTLGPLNDVGYFASGPIRTSSADRTPYEQSWSFGIQQDVGWGTRLDVQYVGKKGTHLYFSGATQLDVLGPQVENYSQSQMSSLVSQVQNPFVGIITDPNSTLSLPNVYGSQLELPNLQFTNVTTDVLPMANSTYHALQIVAEKRYSNGLQLSANYTWSKSIDDSSVYDDNLTWLGSFTSLQDPNKPWLERSLSTFDLASVLKINYSYDLPVGRGRAFLNNMPRALDIIIGGWKTNGVWTFQDGRPLSFSVSNGGTPIPTYGAQRPNMTGKPEVSRGSELNWVNNYFANPDVLQMPDPYTLGNMPRAIGVRSPASATANLSIGKEFGLSNKHEAMKLELRLEAQNAFNHPVFGTPNTSVGDPGFGQITYLAVGPRQGQLALKLVF